jgi:hypothetical protein
MNRPATIQRVEKWVDHYTDWVRLTGNSQLWTIKIATILKINFAQPNSCVYLQLNGCVNI